MAIQLADVFDFQAPFPGDLRHVKSDLNGRNAIGNAQRYIGLEVYVISEDKKYRLVGGTDNGNWVEIEQGGAGGGGNVTWLNNTIPTGGDDGDVAYNDTGSEIQLWYRQGGTWAMLGSWPTGGGSSYTPDGGLPTGAGFLAYLRTNYTDAKVGDVVYREGTTQLIKCTCYYVDANPSLNKWSKITEIIE